MLEVHHHPAEHAAFVKRSHGARGVGSVGRNGDRSVARGNVFERGIQDDAPLIGSGLALDSIDAVELVLKFEKEFGIKIRSSEEARQALASVSSLAAFIRQHADPSRLPA